MKTLNKTTLSIFVAFVLVLTSCGKYEDGPAFSIHTKKNRVIGEWKIESVTLNDTDITSTFTSAVGANYILDLEKDGGYKVTGNFTDEGKWELGADKDDIYMTSNQSGSQEEAYRILRLKTKELWLRHTESNGDVYVFKYAAE